VERIFGNDLLKALKIAEFYFASSLSLRQFFPKQPHAHKQSAAKINKADKHFREPFQFCERLILRLALRIPPEMASFSV
jgi:hypothetical protein